MSEDDLYGLVDTAFAQGWSRVKLYFLIGLPMETDEDTVGIAELARSCAELGRRHSRRATVTASVGGFVPKPHSPFQWFGQDTGAELRRKVPDCRWTPCYDCGVCTGYGIEHVVASPVAPGSQGTGQDPDCGGERPVLLLGARR